MGFGGAQSDLRRTTRRLPSTSGEDQVGNSLCPLPIDNHGKQFAIDIHGPEPGAAVFAHFDHDALPSALARIWSVSMSILPLHVREQLTAKLAKGREKGMQMDFVMLRHFVRYDSRHFAVESARIPKLAGSSYYFRPQITQIARIEYNTKQCMLWLS
jgi:hypothetical protein